MVNDDDQARGGGAKVRPSRGRDTATPRPSTASHRIRWADDSPLDSDDARGRIVAAALDCVRRYGADKTGMDDVAKAAAITRTTVYKYFGSRNELLMAVFLRVLDSKLERGLADFFVGADSVEALHEGVTEATVFILDKLRGDEAIEAILYDSRLPIEDLLTGASSMLVEVMQVAFGNASRRPPPRGCRADVQLDVYREVAGA